MLKIDRNGYIYHLLINYSMRSNPYQINNLCDVIKGLLSAAFLICCVIAVAVVMSVAFFAWTIPFMVHGFSSILFTNDVFIISFGGMSLIILLISVGTISSIRGRQPSREPSFLSVWYDGVKNKYCPRVEFVDKGEEG